MNLRCLPKHITNLIKDNTKAKTKYLIPELGLHLIDETSPWYYKAKVEHLQLDPFWSVYWPGGQALTRFVLDNPPLVRGRTVLDVGSGCGALGIAATQLQSKRVICNDIDVVALAATALNAQLNGTVCPGLVCMDLIGREPVQVLPFNETDVMFLGDMFYDEDTATRVLNWCQELAQIGVEIYIGDPGRWGLEVAKNRLLQVASYPLQDTDSSEFTSTSVYQFLFS